MQKQFLRVLARVYLSYTMQKDEIQPADDISTLERARERLYSPNAAFGEERETVAIEDTQGIPRAWNPAPKTEQPMRARHTRFAALFLGLSFLFFLIAGGTAWYLLYFGTTSVSTSNLDLSVEGPATIVGGDTVPLLITLTNRNPAALRNVTIDLAFPPGTRSAEDVLKEYTRYAETVETLAPGETITRTVKVVMFGGEGAVLSVPIAVSFATVNSNATLVKRSTYSVQVGSSPLSVTVAAPKEAISGKPFTMTLSVRSNARTSVGNVAVTMTEPLGFSLLEASVPFSQGAFYLGTLRAGETRTVTITGSATGPEQSERAFTFTVGTAKSKDDPTLAIAYVSQTAEVTLTAPFIATTLTLGGSPSESVVLAPGDQVSATVAYTNTLDAAVTNAEVAVTISGGAVDYGSIRSSRGFYRSSDHTIIFSKDTDSDLGRFEPGETGLGAFSFTILPGSSIRGSSVTFTISVSGTRTGDSNVPETITASKVVTTKVTSGVVFTATSLHSSGPFANSGPIPPVSDSKTTYTVLWKIQNAGNALADATVSATLPSYVTFTGATSPLTGISYNEATRTMLWSVGNLAANASAQGAFQVALTPSSSQKGSTPALSGGATLSAYDRFAGVPLTITADAVTTETTADPNYKPADGAVR